MPYLSYKEPYDMLVVYFKSLQNAAIDEREYAIRYTGRKSSKAFKRLAV